MNTWAAPGVRCICISDDWGYVERRGCSIPTRVPMINEVLTVKQVSAHGDMVCLTFEEIDEFQSEFKDGFFLGALVSWDAKCFRPLEKRKTSIEIFKKLLTPAGRIPVDA